MRRQVASCPHSRPVLPCRADHCSRTGLSSQWLTTQPLQNLDTEARVGAWPDAAVAMRWSSILEKDIPEEILAEMMLQKEECDRIVLSKDKLIKNSSASSASRTRLTSNRSRSRPRT